MVIHIIRPGNPPEDRTYHAGCTRCGCEFTFQAADATLKSDQREGDYFDLSCPTCNHQIYHNARSGPRR